ncbi:MAG: TRAP transporter large permease subunit [Gammaproteobacteria bacterium]|nr:TRAP transporter large permease subunit [Gammaproteobacteria bacterium]MCP4088737.1 TRAP transporter large permease subunit [Gammaproteobacteria bacterium]MCP4275220.1 TRAP transporter large permease subunit [Gammaproteobacteria bacterium]MCP4830770.1 TRAP transporter large permease subunit [Gammaproteobacteria bacterium]MCP4929559.1 TRAP transporter large permease subunit [Gammaproteobacteria bacterium]
MAWLGFLMFIAVVIVLLAGYPVAFSLAGTALIFACIGSLAGVFDPVFLDTMPNRIYGIMNNVTLIAVPLFVFMGVTLERAQIAEDLLESLSMLMGRIRGGLGIAVILVGMLMAASTGIVGATVVTMGLISLPTMLKRGYKPSIATGTITAAGTLGQIIPPSIILVLLGDVLSSAYQQAQLQQGVFRPETISVGDLFIGALLPGFLLVGLYISYLLIVAQLRPATMPTWQETANTRNSQANLLPQILRALLPALCLILAVLGSIIMGIATPTEAAAIGALGALLLAALRRQLNRQRLFEITTSTARFTSMVFLILIGASMFSLVFRGYGGDIAIQNFLLQLPGGVPTALITVMAVMFLMGFVLDFIEITFVVVPIVGPALLMMGIDPIWLGIMIAINLQTSFLTPPFGFALFYLRGVTPPEVQTIQIYKGVIPFVLIQLFALMLIALWPGLATWLPAQL